MNSVAQQQKCNLLAADHSSQDKRTMMYTKTFHRTAKNNKVETTYGATVTF